MPARPARSALKIIEKTHVGDKGKPGFRWLGPEGLQSLRPIAAAALPAATAAFHHLQPGGFQAALTGEMPALQMAGGALPEGVAHDGTQLPTAAGLYVGADHAAAAAAAAAMAMQPAAAPAPEDEGAAAVAVSGGGGVKRPRRKSLRAREAEGEGEEGGEEGDEDYEPEEEGEEGGKKHKRAKGRRAGVWVGEWVGGCGPGCSWLSGGGCSIVGLPLLPDFAHWAGCLAWGRPCSSLALTAPSPVPPPAAEAEQPVDAAAAQAAAVAAAAAQQQQQQAGQVAMFSELPLVMPAGVDPAAMAAAMAGGYTVDMAAHAASQQANKPKVGPRAPGVVGAWVVQLARAARSVQSLRSLSLEGHAVAWSARWPLADRCLLPWPPPGPPRCLPQVHPLLKFMELESQTEQGSGGMRRVVGADVMRADGHVEGQVGGRGRPPLSPSALSTRQVWGRGVR